MISLKIQNSMNVVLKITNHTNLINPRSTRHGVELNSNQWKILKRLRYNLVLHLIKAKSCGVLLNKFMHLLQQNKLQLHKEWRNMNNAIRQILSQKNKNFYKWHLNLTKENLMEYQPKLEVQPVLLKKFKWNSHH